MASAGAMSLWQSEGWLESAAVGTGAGPTLRDTGKCRDRVALEAAAAAAMLVLWNGAGNWRGNLRGQRHGPRAQKGQGAGRSLTGKKKCSGTSFPKKSPWVGHVLNHGWWRLVVGGWWRLAVGGWWRLAVDGSWRLAVGGPLGRSLTKKKTSGSLRTALAGSGQAQHTKKRGTAGAGQGWG